MTRLHLVSLCLIGLCTPALAQITMTLPSADVSMTSDSSAVAPDGTDTAAPSDEQPAGPPVPSKDALADFAKTCTDISGGDPAAYDRATSDGWTPDDTSGSGPYRSIYSGTKDVSGYGSVTVWGSVDKYPTQTLGYCRIDLGDYDSTLNLSDLTGVQGLTGSVTSPDADGNIFGAWETADKKLLVIADRTDGQVEIEFNLLLGDKK